MDVAAAIKRRTHQRKGKKQYLLYPEYKDHAATDMEWVTQRVHFKENKAKKSKGGPMERFPLKLMDMLHCIENSNDTCVVAGFLPHGRAFKVHCKRQFERDVLPQYFKRQTTYASFIRQLNQYGFRRLTAHGPDQDGYYHELFLRGRRDLCHLIPRHKECSGGAGSGSSVRMSYDPKSQPDFYAMIALPTMTICEPEKRTVTDIAVTMDNAHTDSIISLPVDAALRYLDASGCTVQSLPAATRESLATHDEYNWRHLPLDTGKWRRANNGCSGGSVVLPRAATSWPGLWESCNEYKCHTPLASLELESKWQVSPTHSDHAETGSIYDSSERRSFQYQYPVHLCLRTAPSFRRLPLSPAPPSGHGPEPEIQKSPPPLDSLVEAMILDMEPESVEGILANEQRTSDLELLLAAAMEWVGGSSEDGGSFRST